MKKQLKAAQTTKQRYGDDFYRKIAKFATNPNKGNTEYMTALANARWAKYRLEKELKERS